MSPPGHSSWNAGEVVAARFVVRAALGSGSLGECYLAHDQRTEIDVLLRVPFPSLLPDEGARRAFRQRMGEARRLRHPYLVSVYDVVEHAGRADGLVVGHHGVAHVGGQRVGRGGDACRVCIGREHAGLPSDL